MSNAGGIYTPFAGRARLRKGTRQREEAEEGAEGVSCVGNNLHVGRDDDDRGMWSPAFAIVCKNLQNCVIANNVLHEGALRQLIVDQGGHGEGVVLKDNPGSLFKAPE
jgi:hypothetical protein